MIVIENNVGATSRKGVSRFFGSIVGGVLVFGAISLISWGGDRWVIGTDSTGVAIIAPGVLYTTRYGIGPLSSEALDARAMQTLSSAGTTPGGRALARSCSPCSPLSATC